MTNKYDFGKGSQRSSRKLKRDREDKSMERRMVLDWDFQKVEEL